MTDLNRAVALLQSEDAAGPLRAALTGAADADLAGFGATLTTWQYRPGAEVTAGYVVDYTVAGSAVTEYLFATTAEVSGPAVVTAGDLALRVWRHPHDPLLPGLAPACDPDLVVTWPGVGPGLQRLELLGYRPLRRAVLRATGTSGTAYLKVLRPARADRLAIRQHLFAAAGLTPAPASRPAPGVLVTPAAPGVPLAEALAGAAEPPSPTALVDVLDALPPGLLELDRRPAWSDRLDFHAATAVQRLPAQAHRITSLAEGLTRVLAAAPVGPVVATHGDFYEANILLDGSRIALIDLENAGPGRREDDLACLLAHLAVLPGLSPAHYGRVPALLEAWTRDAAARVHPDALAARVGAVVLSLVAGGDDAQAGARLDLAAEWLASCR